MKKTLITFALMVSIISPQITHAGFFDKIKSVFGGTTIKQDSKQINNQTSTTTIGATTNKIEGDTIQGDTNTVNIPENQKSQLFDGNLFNTFNPAFLKQQELNQEEINTLKRLIEASEKNTKQAVETFNKGVESSVKQSKENTSILETPLKEISATMKLPPALKLDIETQTLLNTLNTQLVTPLQNIASKIELVGSQLTTNNTALISAITNMPLPTPGGGGGSGESVSKSITQTAHGFTVGKWVYILSSGVYALADADNGSTADSIGMVTTVTDANTFTITTFGYVTGLTGKTPGSASFISSTAGDITETEPTGVSTTRKPVFIAETATTGWIIDRSGTPVVGSTAVVSTGQFSGLTTTTFATATSVKFANTISGNIAYNSTTGSFSLIAGNTYKLQAQLRLVSGNADFGWTDTAGTALVANSQTDNAATNVGGMLSNEILYTAPTNIDVQFRCVVSASAVGQSSMASASIVQIGASPVPMSFAGEYGENTSITNGASTSSATFNDLPNSSFTLPTAGVWEVVTTIYTSNLTSGGYNIFQLYTAGDVIVPNTMTVTGASAANNFTHHSSVVRITTTDSATYKLKFRANSGTAVVSNGVDGNTKITWKKISGFIPSSGQTVDYVYAKLVANQTISSSPIDVNFTSTAGSVPVSAGVFTLTAGKTYSLRSVLVTSNNAAAANWSAQWVDAVSNTAIGSSTNPVMFAPNSGANDTVSNETAVIYTPTANQTVKVRFTALGGLLPAAVIYASQSFATIQQLGSSAVIAGVYPGTTTNYTPIVTSTGGTNPTLPTSAVISGYYSVEGKMMTLNFKYFAATTTNGADGTQSYQYSMPAGYTIDLTKVAVPSVLTNTAGSGLDGGTIGVGFGRNATASNSSGLGVVPLSATTFGFYFEGGTRLVGASSLAMTGASNTSIWATLRIPIN